MEDVKIEACARAAHEALSAYCAVIGEGPGQSWDVVPEWQRVSVRKGVLGVLAGNTPKQSHESWLDEKCATGWKYEVVKDEEKKEHPCFLPYAELSPEQRAKDYIFVGVVKTMAAALGLM